MPTWAPYGMIVGKWAPCGQTIGIGVGPIWAEAKKFFSSFSQQDGMVFSPLLIFYVFKLISVIFDQVQRNLTFV